MGNGDREAQQYAWPSLSVVSVPMEEMAQECFRLLLRLIAGEIRPPFGRQDGGPVSAGGELSAGGMKKIFKAKRRIFPEKKGTRQKAGRLVRKRRGQSVHSVLPKDAKELCRSARSREMAGGRREMRIAGLQKLTLLDYPGHLACTVFLEGCNLRCPFCHNASLVLPERAGEDERSARRSCLPS